MKWVGKKVLCLSPDIHGVVVVALFVSVVANLIVAFYTDACRNSNFCVPAIFAFGAAFLYVRVAHKGRELWQEAYSRGGVLPRAAVKQLAGLPSKKRDLAEAGWFFLGSLIVFLVALIALYCMAWKNHQQHLKEQSRSAICRASQML